MFHFLPRGILFPWNITFLIILRFSFFNRQSVVQSSKQCIPNGTKRVRVFISTGCVFTVYYYVNRMPTPSALHVSECRKIWLLYSTSNRKKKVHWRKRNGICVLFSQTFTTSERTQSCNLQLVQIIQVLQYRNFWNHYKETRICLNSSLNFR